MPTVKKISDSYTIQSNTVAITNNALTANLSVNGQQVGYLTVPQIAFTNDATVFSNVSGKHYYSTLSTDKILTLANTVDVSYTIGTQFTIVNLGTGNITLANAAGVSLYLAGNTTPDRRIITQFSGVATVLNVASNIWIISGAGVK